jgi:hypothetical protein
LRNLIALSFEEADHAGLEIVDWLKSNHIPFERA